MYKYIYFLLFNSIHTFDASHEIPLEACSTNPSQPTSQARKFQNQRSMMMLFELNPLRVRRNLTGSNCIHFLKWEMNVVRVLGGHLAHLQDSETPRFLGALPFYLRASLSFRAASKETAVSLILTYSRHNPPSKFHPSHK